MGLTQSSLAEKLGITDRAVSKWERGIAKPSCEHLKILSEMFEYDFDVKRILDELGNIIRGKEIVLRDLEMFKNQKDKNDN